MAAERRRGRKDYVIADHAIVSDMAAVHEVAALANTGDAAAGHGAGAHGRLLANGAAAADLQLCQFAAKGERLWRGAQRDERVDRAIVANRGLRRDIDMREQLAIG